MIERLNNLIAKAKNNRKDAIENGDRKGRWYAEGQIDALTGFRIELETNGSDRDIAIGEHAFKAGFDASLMRLFNCTADEFPDTREAAWSEYTPPDDLCGG